VIIGVDPGERRVGIAIADDETRFARALEVIDRRDTDPVARIAELASELEAHSIVVGRPTDLKGAAGPAVVAQQLFIEDLRAGCSVSVIEHDERFTSVIADRALRDAGKSTKEARAFRDAVAAQVLLQDYLDTHA
jgi:putative holliday junction resolvase